MRSSPDSNWIYLLMLFHAIFTEAEFCSMYVPISVLSTFELTAELIAVAVWVIVE